MTRQTEGKTPKKKPYLRPDIRQVELLPDEAVLGLCKTTGTTGPGGQSCNQAIFACATIGS